jgi:predicted nuclease with RNAse H fold
MRAASGRRLGRELRKLREEGTDVLCLQPTADDIAVMGNNLMSRKRRIEVLEQAQLTTARELRAGRAHLPKLPRASRRRRVAAVPQQRKAA